MVFIPDNKLKQKMSKNGSVLQYMYSVSGAGKGLIARGVMLIVIAAMLSAALFQTTGAAGVMKMAAAIIIPSVLLIVWGVFLQKKKESGWMKAYTQAGPGLSEQEVHQIDQEFQREGTVLFSLDNGKDANSLKKMGFITANYLKFPGTNPCVFRLEDMVACFYTRKKLCDDGGYDRALIAYAVDGEWGYYVNSPPEKASIEIVKTIGEHNSKIITEHFFAYEGKEYDSIKGADEVIALHKQVFRKG